MFTAVVRDAPYESLGWKNAYRVWCPAVDVAEARTTHATESALCVGRVDDLPL